MDDLFANLSDGLTPRPDKTLANPTFSFSGGSGENIFAVQKELNAEKKLVDSPIESQKKPSVKRLNDLDGNILTTHFTHNGGNKTFFQRVLYKFFGKIRTKKIISDALKELTTLSKVANELITKQIPYGEQDATYEDLIAYLRSANIIHSKLKGKI